MKILDPPCRYCTPPKRNEYCHGNCQEYKDWAGEVKAIKQKAWNDTEGRRKANERMMDVSAKRERRKHMNGR